MSRSRLGALVAASLLAMPACGGDNGDVSAFCESRQRFDEAAGSLSTIHLGDPEAAQRALEDAGSQLDEAADTAPDEIRREVESIAELFNDLTKEISEADSLEDVMPLLGELQADAPEVDEAIANIDEFVTENCDTRG